MKVVAIFFLCLIGVLATNNVWEIFKSQPSSKSRFYVLHNWNGGEGVYSDVSTEAFPAEQVSNIMLRTMGFLRDGASWNGVHHGSLFKRPKATALFLVDGLSDDVNLNLLSESSYPVDQSSLMGGVTQDVEMMFSGDNILEHIHGLFSQSMTQFISGDEQLSSLLSPKKDSMALEKPSNEEVFRIANDNNFDPNCKVVSSFLSELLTVQSAVSKLSKPTNRAPDVFVFSFASVRAMQVKYGVKSAEMATALKMMTGTIKEVSDALVETYDGDIVVQALVLQWKYETLSDQELKQIRTVLQDHMFSAEEAKNILSSLPRIELPNMDYYVRSSLCEDLAYILETENIEFNAECKKGRSMLKRSVEEYSYFDDINEDSNKTSFSVPQGLVEARTDDFPAMFLIIFVTVVPMGLALFAISWAMWNMDPGRDSIIYRNTDNIPGINAY